MKDQYIGKRLCDIPYDAIEVGMEVRGNSGISGKVGHKTMPPFESDGFIRIDWNGFNPMSNYQSRLHDVVAKSFPEPQQTTIELTLKAEFFTFESIARGTIMHATLYNPTDATREALTKVITDAVIAKIKLKHTGYRDRSTNEDHDGLYEIMAVFADPKNDDEVLHVLFKNMDLFHDVRTE